MDGKIIAVLIISYFIYLLIGGAIFMAIEGPYNKDQCKTANESIVNLTEQIATIVTIDGEPFPTDLLRQLSQMMSDASAYGYTFDNDTKRPTCADLWSYEGSVFFAGTVVTTIGYGNMSPKSPAGRVMCIIYALIGIPLFAMMFAGLGEKIADLVLKLEEKINGKATKSWVRKLVLVLIVALLFTVLCLVIPAAIFQAVEDKWSYGDGFYYSFITISTIGFGDLVAGTSDQKYIPIYRIMVYFWILFGMAFMATVWSLITNFYKTTGKRGQNRVNKRRAGSRHGDEVDGQELEKNDPDVDDRTEADGNNSEAQEYLETNTKPGIYTIGTAVETQYENTKFSEPEGGEDNPVASL